MFEEFSINMNREFFEDIAGFVKKLPKSAQEEYTRIFEKHFPETVKGWEKQRQDQMAQEKLESEAEVFHQ